MSKTNILNICTIVALAYGISVTTLSAGPYAAQVSGQGSSTTMMQYQQIAETDMFMQGPLHGSAPVAGYGDARSALLIGMLFILLGFVLHAYLLMTTKRPFKHENLYPGTETPDWHDDW